MAAISGAAETGNSRFFTGTLTQSDPEIGAAIGRELRRQQEFIELIASENIVSKAVLEAQGSVLTNKYAEGYPGRRYYGGCEYVDEAEELAIERARRLFGCEFANVQPQSILCGDENVGAGIARASRAGRVSRHSGTSSASRTSGGSGIEGSCRAIVAATYSIRVGMPAF